MTNLLLAATSLTAVPSSAAPLEDASTPAQGFAGQTAFEPIAARIPPHTPEWTNPNQSDPGVTSMEVFAWLGEAAAYRALARTGTVASTAERAVRAGIGSGVAEGLAVESRPGDPPLSVGAGEAVGPDGTALGHDTEWKYVNVRRFYGP